MIVYDVATKFLDTEIFPQGKIAGLISRITLKLMLLLYSVYEKVCAFYEFRF